MKNQPTQISISIVTYNPDLLLFEKSICSIDTAIKNLSDTPLSLSKLYIIDNSENNNLITLLTEIIKKNFSFPFEITKNPSNLGFGKGHNVILNKIVDGELPEWCYHLVLNPDVLIEPHSIKNALLYLMENRDVGMISPKVYGKNGGREYLCKNYPSVFDLFLRGFAPKWIKILFKDRLERYEMKNETQDNINNGIPIASGCFMLLNNRAIKEVGLFDKIFFLYFEDFDYSLRLIKKNWKICYHPQVIITHFGGYTSKKGIKHIIYFIESGIKFFNKHGWKFI